MKKISLWVAILMCAGVMGYAEEADTLNLQNALQEKTTVAEQENIKSIMKKVTLEQFDAMYRVQSVLNRMLGEAKEKAAADKRAFEAAQILESIASVHGQLLLSVKEAGVTADQTVRAIVLGMCVLNLQNAFNRLQTLDERLYKDVLFLFSDPRLPNIERGFIQCLDEESMRKMLFLSIPVGRAEMIK